MTERGYFARDAADAFERERRELAQRLAAAVRPGGWLCLEESDRTSFGAADPEHPAVAGFNRRSRALIDALNATGFEALPSGAISPATPPDSWYTRAALPIYIPPRRTLPFRGTGARGLEARP